MGLLTDKLDVSWEHAPEIIDSKRTARELFSSLESSLAPKTTEDYLKIFIEAPNLLSACIDYNVAHNFVRDHKHINKPCYTQFVKSAFRNDFERAKNELALLRQDAPNEFLETDMEFKKDITTWQSTNPDLLKGLSDRIRDSYNPELIISPAHGSIRPAILLSILLNADIYFIRLSRFKRADVEPRVGYPDMDFLKQIGDKRVLCYDEDTASGQTLDNFARYLRRHAKNLKTATTRRFHLTRHNPDFFAESFY